MDYLAEAEQLGKPLVPIVDAHAHITGVKAASIYKDVADIFGVVQVYSMSRFEEASSMKDVLGDRIRFIAVPDYWSEEDSKYHMGEGYVKRIEEWHAVGARIAKFWVAPRSIDYAMEMANDSDFLKINSPTKIAAMEAANSLGMIFMTHVADPDTWFKAKYTDTKTYGTKLQQYEPFEEMLDRFTQPWIAAHMGGWPEDLEFLNGLLDRHDNLYFDLSACKWQVRELSKHSRDDLITFFTKFRGRILFGSDIVTTDDHLAASTEETELQQKAGNEHEAFDLYASRYWAYRTMLETTYQGESPIADPDLAMVDPEKFDEMDAPEMTGKSLPPDILRSLYRDTAIALLDPIYD